MPALSSHCRIGLMIVILGCLAEGGHARAEGYWDAIRQPPPRRPAPVPAECRIPTVPVPVEGLPVPFYFREPRQPMPFELDVDLDPPPLFVEKQLPEVLPTVTGPDSVPARIRARVAAREREREVAAGHFPVLLRIRVAELNLRQMRRMGLTIEGLSTANSAADVNRVLDRLTGHGAAKILSEPELPVLNGHQVTVMVRGTHSGFSLAVTPTVLASKQIDLRVQAEFALAGSPAASVRRLASTVRMQAGASYVVLGQAGRPPVLDQAWWQAVTRFGAPFFTVHEPATPDRVLIAVVHPEPPLLIEDHAQTVPGFELAVPDDYLIYAKAFEHGNDRAAETLPPAVSEYVASEQSETIRVFVTGAVEKPGIYEFSRGMRDVGLVHELRDEVQRLRREVRELRQQLDER